MDIRTIHNEKYWKLVHDAIVRNIGTPDIPEHWVIAGGFVRDAICGLTPRDMDVFIYSPLPVTKHGELSGMEHPVQIIPFRHPNPITDFDLLPCCVQFVCRNSVWQLEELPGAIECIEGMVLRRNPNKTTFNNKHAGRIEKFARRGWDASAVRSEPPVAVVELDEEQYL